ncbi:hypothetical protein MMC25_003373 [Agyrium rufum]|nr:hypothetical protein [Agyrium rufum]
MAAGTDFTVNYGHNQTDDQEGDDSEWEYEYDDTETETFYVTLDLPITKNRTKTQQQQQPVFHSGVSQQPGSLARPAAAESKGDDGRDPAERANATLPSPPFNPSTAPAHPLPPASNPVDPQQQQQQNHPPDAHEPPSRVQILGLHTPHPVIAYENQIYSCQWSAIVGTDIFLTRPAETTYEPVWQAPGVSILTTAAFKVVGQPVSLVPKTEVRLDRVTKAAEKAAIRESTNQIRPADVSTVSESPRDSPSAAESILVIDKGDDGTGSVAGMALTSNTTTTTTTTRKPAHIPVGPESGYGRHSQARFLERLIDLKAQSGATDQVPVLTKKKFTGTSWRSWGKTGGQGDPDAAAPETEDEDDGDENGDEDDDDEEGSDVEYDNEPAAMIVTGGRHHTVPVSQDRASTTTSRQRGNATPSITHTANEPSVSSALGCQTPGTPSTPGKQASIMKRKPSSSSQAGPYPTSRRNLLTPRRRGGKGRQRGRGGLFRDYVPQVGDAIGADIRARPQQVDHMSRGSRDEYDVRMIGSDESSRRRLNFRSGGSVVGGKGLEGSRQDTVMDDAS